MGFYPNGLDFPRVGGGPKRQFWNHMGRTEAGDKEEDIHPTRLLTPEGVGGFSVFVGPVIIFYIFGRWERRLEAEIFIFPLVLFCAK